MTIIVLWNGKVNATNGRIVAGGNGPGDQADQLTCPTDVIIDRENNSLIIVDSGNRRVMRWSRQTNSHGQIIISDIDCLGLTMHKDGSLYVPDYKKNEVRRWREGETDGIIVAGGKMDKAISSINSMVLHISSLMMITHCMSPILAIIV